MGKFTKFSTLIHEYVEKLSLFIINEEINENINIVTEIDKKLKEAEINQETNGLEILTITINNCKHIIQTLLDLMNDNFYRTDVNKKIIGRIFEDYITKIFGLNDKNLSKEAVQFIGKWYPIAKSDNFKYEGLKLIKEGNKLAMDICEDKPQELNILKKKRECYDKKISVEQIKYEKLKMVLRQLFFIPGTYTTLEGNKGLIMIVIIIINNNKINNQYYDSGLLRTEMIVMFLPIDPNSTVRIIRPLPKIPGVPENATSVPLVYSENSISKKYLNELSLFEKKEKCGLIPELPIGFSYNPGIFDKEKQKAIDGYDYEENKLPKNTVSVPTRPDKSTAPPGKK
ncbi:hypothetical protein LY90DRAFT_503606 [Neocallimastix californiae]|uniref:Uncharacterized protein n=1 Tax=Neocallimastix californiae TaxID=1754190 RepID=A0A1Y2EM94_9FUNG|nr:hypothetical protein LY90DRAFT_503606 [Neocallimastix californiae]|eukprot:ORY72657.1 hypothetical protein LY90DRAFT_503606 [Neocallimastix californiae]